MHALYTFNLVKIKDLPNDQYLTRFINYLMNVIIKFFYFKKHHYNKFL